MLNIRPDVLELLRKVYKKTIASFTVAQWKTVLTELGYKVSIEKDRNTAVAFRVVAHDGTEIVETKRENYRRLVIYDTERWLYAHGLRERARVALGIDPDEERNKKLYVRDLTNTGTCGVCLGNYKRERDGSLHIHGYTRPGDGWLHGSCYGVGYQPWELSKLAVVGYVRDVLEPALEVRLRGLKQLIDDSVEVFYDKVHRWEGGRSVAATVEVRRDDKWKFDQLRQRAIISIKSEIGQIEEDIKRCKDQLASWKLDDLPEVKHAGKFKVDR